MTSRVGFARLGVSKHLFAATCGVMLSVVWTPSSFGQGTANEQSETQLSETERELDKLLIGPWSLVTKDLTKDPPKEKFEVAAKRCLTLAKLKGLQIAPKADKTLPDKTSFRGSVAWYRTKTGLQLLSFEDRMLVAFDKVEKAQNRAGRDFFTLSSGRVRMNMIFSATPANGRNRSSIMLTQTGLYLKCPAPRVTN